MLSNIWKNICLISIQGCFRGFIRSKNVHNHSALLKYEFSTDTLQVIRIKLHVNDVLTIYYHNKWQEKETIMYGDF